MKELNLLTDRTAAILDRDRDDELYAAEQMKRESPSNKSVDRILTAARERFAATKTRTNRWRNRIITVG